ncbi:MAG: glucosaminidase domain-containing protein [Hyphomicrobium sp.]|uniref:glucosaminidase domain-containing protein n=1 Tax=Hyphomicrobium sp. TaxID=82 RepID=UPI003D13DA2D
MTCRSRSHRAGVAILASVVLAPSVAGAAELPPIRGSESNHVATCATPGRLMAYVHDRNPKLNPRYETLASEYMRHGEALNVRWDYAFFQMLLETGYLTYTGDVKPEQNNFAGLGATGNGARGESFKDISAGARAHIEHLVMYSGDRVENPVAERTRNVQEWGVLTDWQKNLSGPITFSQLASKWAPGTRRYAADIESIANRFFDGICKEPDPVSDVIAAAESPPEEPAPRKTKTVAKAETRAETVPELPPAEELVASPAAKEVAIKEDVLPAKGAAAVAAVASDKAKAEASKAKTEPAKVEPAKEMIEPRKDKGEAASATVPPITLLNPTPSADAPVEPTATDAKAAAEGPVKGDKEIEVAALPGAIKDAGKVEAKSEPKAEKKSEKKADKKGAGASGKCRVWTASYGGSKAIIIKAVADKTTNYTVLDVNEGAEKREADAYINAYAKGGESVGEFASQSQALEKAFELCPEG